MREVERFEAVADDGRRVVIVVMEDVIAVGSNDDPHATIGGLKEAVTDTGEPVVRIDDDTFRVPSIGIVRRVRSRRAD
jgi:hypothetical protein